MAHPNARKRVVICGGGIMGCSIAYHLTHHPRSATALDVTIVERCDIACGASGKAGGFLAKTWCDSGPLKNMVHASFDLHCQLAETLGKQFDTGFRFLDTFGVVANEEQATVFKKMGKLKHEVELPAWIDGKTEGSSVMGGRDNTAQVHPEKLTRAFAEAAKLKGAKVLIGAVVGMEFSEDSSTSDARTVTGVKVAAEGSAAESKEQILPADVVVIAMGPWSGQAAEWFSLPIVRGLKAHSIVLQPEPADAITAHALFITWKRSNGSTIDPEIYPRPDGQVYICGMSEEETIPPPPSEVRPTEDSCSVLTNMAATLSAPLKSARLLKEQACFLPTSPDDVPLVGRIPDSTNGFIAAGHSCWGILNAPATGAALADVILTGQTNIFDLAPFDPKRLLKPSRRNK